VGVEKRLLSVDAPPWLHLGTPAGQPMIVAPQPSFIKLD
jgi:hypothetical protein